jgi:hypothetical protein
MILVASFAEDDDAIMLKGHVVLLAGVVGNQPNVISTRNIKRRKTPKRMANVTRPEHFLLGFILFPNQESFARFRNEQLNGQ